MAVKRLHFRLIKQLLWHKDDQGTAETTLTAAAAAGASAITVASIAGFATGGTCRVGDGEKTELNKVSSASGNTVNLTWPLAQSHVVGESARPQKTYDMGSVSDGGVTVTVEGDNVDVLVADRRTVYTNLVGFARAFIEGQFVAFTLNLFAHVLGMLVSRVTGAGTPASPYQLITGGDEAGEDQNQSVTVVGTLVDGTTAVAEVHGIDFDHTTVKTTLNRGALTGIPFKAKGASQVAFATVDPAYTVDTSLRPTKAKVFDAPSEVGVYVPAGGGGNTTLSAAPAAGATAISVASSLNFAAGDYVKIDVGENAEVHQIDSITGAGPFTFNLRTKLLRGHANAATVVEQTQTPWAELAEDGITFETSGDNRDVKFASKRFEAGLVQGTAMFTLSWLLSAFKLSNIAYSLGVPQSAIASGRLVVGDNVGSSQIGEVYAKGLLQDGSTVSVEAYGCSQQLQNFALKLSNKDIAKIPLTLRPSSAIALRQYL